MSKTYSFSLPDISCQACSSAIYHAIDAYTKNTLFTIEERSIDVSDKTLTITLEQDYFNTDEIINELNQVVLISSGFECQLSTTPQKKSQHWLLGMIGVGLGGLLLLMTMIFPVWSMPLMIVSGLISTVLTIVLGKYSFQEAFKKFSRARLMTMDTLFVISALTAVIASVVAIFIPGWPMMFEAGLLMFGFRHVGLAMEEKFNETMGQSWRFKSLIPPEDRRVYEVGETILIQPGKILPVDGICLRPAMIIETIRTGMLQPRSVYPNEHLVAGMTVPENAEALYLQVTHRMEDSELARLDQAILKSKSQKTRLQSLTDRGLQYFIPAVLILSLFSLAIVGSFWGPALAIQCMVAVLVSACPCVLGMITPLMMNIGLYKARRQGVLFQQAKRLEDAGNVDTVLFDMTGTLTTGVPVMHGEPQILDKNWTKERLLETIGAIEADATHTFALAMQFPTQMVASQKINLAHGRQGEVGGRTYYVGDERLMRDLGVDLPVLGELDPGDRVMYLASQQALLGYIVLRDTIRPEAWSVVQQLQAKGKRVGVVSGSHKTAVERDARTLGINLDWVRAECRPDDKVAFLQQLRETGSRSIAMVGDGINDSQILSESDLSIVVQSAGNNLITSGQADVLAGGSLFSVLVALEVAQRTVQSIQSSLLINLVYNLAVLTVACGALLLLGVALNPGVGAGLMILQSFAVFMHAWYFHQQPLTLNAHTHVPSIANGQGLTDCNANEIELESRFQFPRNVFGNGFN